MYVSFHKLVLQALEHNKINIVFTYFHMGELVCLWHLGVDFFQENV